MRWRNGQSAEKPETCVPPVGSTSDLLHFVNDVVDKESSAASNKTVTCHRRYAHSAMACMTRTFSQAYFDLVDHAANATLLSAGSVDARLAEAGVPLPADAARPRYTFVPAAVGTSPQVLPPSTFRTYALDFFVRFRNTSGTGSMPDVHVADVPTWLGRHFSERDYIVAKVDIEAAEHDLFHELRRRDLLRLLDVVTYECHTYARHQNCTALYAMMLENQVPVVHLCKIQARAPLNRTDDAKCGSEDRARFMVLARAA